MHDALRRCRRLASRRSPATDLPGADRLCHVGSISYRLAARRVNAGRMTPRPGEVLMVSGRQDTARIACAFRVPRGAEPALSPPAAQRRAGGRGAAGADHPPVEQALCRSRNIVGIYNTGLGVPRLPRRWPATAAKATSAGSPMSVTTPPGSSWRRAAGVNARSEHPPARPAGDRPDAAPSGVRLPAANHADGKVDFILYSAENVD